jgi:DNA primase
VNPSEEIKQRLDIVDVIGETVNLHKAGRNYKALCPFHTEKTPSFFVFPDRQSWHCFGACSTGGDIFAFVMRKDDLDFSGALRLLAERAGITLRQKTIATEKKERERLWLANEAAVTLFQHALLNTQAGEPALNYLAMRGIDRETAEGFQLGYSPDSWDALREHLKGRGFAEAELLQAGLLVESEHGLYDRFRNRVIFPIRDERGRVAGFGSRSLVVATHGLVEGGAQAASGDDSPKYVNTPQTPIFDKGNILYGLDRAKEHIRRSDLAVIVEGYMDVIAAHQHENRNVVASMGTALTERQLDLLRGLTENIVLAFDPDEAGDRGGQTGIVREAEIRSKADGARLTWEFLSFYRRELGAKIRLMKRPEGQDPDQIIRSSPEQWRLLVARAEPLETDLLMDKAMQAIIDRRRRRSDSARPAVAADEEGTTDTGKGEELCLALLLRYPELRPQGLALRDDLFVAIPNRQLFQAWREASEEGALRASLPEELYEHLDRIVSKDLSPHSAQAEKSFTSCIRQIERRKLKEAKTATSNAIAETEKDLGAARLARSAHQLLYEGDLPEDLPEDEALPASIVVRGMETGREMHTGLREGRPKED